MSSPGGCVVDLFFCMMICARVKIVSCTDLCPIIRKKNFFDPFPWPLTSQIGDIQWKLLDEVGSFFSLKGKLQCGAGNLIHVTSVTKGFSINNQCQPVRDGCDEPSTFTSCTGRSDSCGVTVAQSYMQRCGRWTNYIRVQYECIPGKVILFVLIATRLTLFLKKDADDDD